MKTYYDLTKKERKTYEKEFFKTTVGSSMHYVNVLLEIILLLVMFLDFLLLMFVSDQELAANGMYITGLAFWLFLAANCVYMCYVNISFSMWLKIKHDIRRW